MLIIRKEQIEVFEKIAMHRFEDTVFEIIIEEYPVKCEEPGEDQVRESIKTGIIKAKKYDIEIEAYVAEYIKIMHELSFDFDESTDTQWAADILNNADINEKTKIEELRNNIANNNL